jgi:MSHA biogenesis protein MshN
MSLLNDALRAAEQRQKRPAVATAYVGQNHSRQGSRRWLTPLLLLIITILAVVALYGRFNRDSVKTFEVAEYKTESAATKASPSTASALPPATDVVVTTVKPKATGAETDLLILHADSADKFKQPSVQPANATSVPAPETAADVQKAPAEVVILAEIPPPAAEASSEAPVTSSVKQQRETPKAADLRASRQMSRLLQSGDVEAAEALMGQLEKIQTAPVSREVLVRSLLIQGMSERALHWLSAEETENYPALRLLKSRGLLSIGDLSGAVATLLQDVPPVHDHIEYRVTLATLLQQAGQSMESARQWSVLISIDDSRAAWWVGLAIALESQGEAGAAVRAYSQAAQLPGLSPSLADYVRERMHKLQAG